MTHAVAVRRLEEAVASHHGPDGDGLEENVVSGVSGHDRILRATDPSCFGTRGPFTIRVPCLLPAW